MPPDAVIGVDDLTVDAGWERNQQQAMRAMNAGLDQAEQGAGQVTRALGELVALYDVEIVEGFEEGDIRHELETIRRSLRNIRRIAKVRQAEWDATGSVAR